MFTWAVFSVGWLSSIFPTESAVQGVSQDSSTQQTPAESNQQNQLLTMLATKLGSATRKPSMNVTAAPKRVKYDDYQIWRLMPSTQAHVEYLREVKETNEYAKLLWLKGPAMR